MDLKLTDKVALITGTGSQIGFGKSIALTLAREWCHIISVDIDLEGAEKTAAEIRALGRKAMAIKAAVSVPGLTGIHSSANAAADSLNTGSTKINFTPFSLA